MGVRLLLVVSMIGLWFVLSPTSGYACSCAPPGPPAEALAESELVFRGTVTSIGPSDGAGLLKVDFDVATVWKGPASKTASLTTQRDTAACGYPFEERVEYVVYSWNGVDVARCSRTAPVELAGERHAVAAVVERHAGRGDDRPYQHAVKLFLGHLNRSRRACPARRTNDRYPLRNLPRGVARTRVPTAPWRWISGGCCCSSRVLQPVYRAAGAPDYGPT